MMVASKASVRRRTMSFDHVSRSMVKAMTVRITAASIHPKNSIIPFLQDQYSETVEAVSISAWHGGVCPVIIRG